MPFNARDATVSVSAEEVSLFVALQDVRVKFGFFLTTLVVYNAGEQLFRVWSSHTRTHIESLEVITIDKEVSYAVLSSPSMTE